MLVREGFRAYKGKIYNGALKSYHILMEVVYSCIGNKG